MTKESAQILLKLRDTGQTVADPTDDLRGPHVHDKDGQDIGTVHDLPVDSAEHKVRVLRLEHGGTLGFGATSSFVPVQAISRITDETVFSINPAAPLPTHLATIPTWPIKPSSTPTFTGTTGT